MWQRQAPITGIFQMTFIDQTHHTVTWVLLITLTESEDHCHFTAPAPGSVIAELLRGRSGISYLPFGASYLSETKG